MRLFPLSESALTVELGNEILPELNARAIAIAQHFEAHPFAGLVEAVPAYASVTLFYDPGVVKRSFPRCDTAFAAVSGIAKQIAETIASVNDGKPRLIEIPMIVSDDASPDLDTVSRHSGLNKYDVIETFLSRTYRVYMLGFLPGFAYMGEVDERIATPRLAVPRTRVPKGSIGIAGKQTGIYPLASPGGWNIVGRTELKMFDPAAEFPCLLAPGDEVRFVQV